MNTKKRQRIIVLLTGVLALALLASCSRQVTKPLEKGDIRPTKVSKPAEENHTADKTSAGVTIYGNPEQIEVFSGGKRLVLKPGDGSYSKITSVCERIVLRVGASANEPPVSDASYIKMRGVAFRAVRLTYHREPVFVFFGTIDRIKQNKTLVGAKGLKQVTFFVPVSAASLKPDTIFDGFYYGNIHMVSTLTNTDLLELVKGLQ
ncbi:MAG: hypothetical protein ACYC56_10040 [Candidatus Aquicultor sp.]